MFFHRSGVVHPGWPRLIVMAVFMLAVIAAVVAVVVVLVLSLIHI